MFMGRTVHERIPSVLYWIVEFVGLPLEGTVVGPFLMDTFLISTLGMSSVTFSRKRKYSFLQEILTIEHEVFVRSANPS